MPSTPYDARGLLRSSIRDDDPVLFFEHKKMYRSVRGDVPDTDYTVPLGKAKITHPGTQVTVVAYGLMAHYALEAADRVAEDGISAEVVDLRTLRPLDRETLLDSVRKTGKCLVVYEDNKFGGYGAEVAAIVAEEAFDYLDGPVTRIAGPEVPGVPYNHVLEDWFMVNPEKIAEGIRTLAAYYASHSRVLDLVWALIRLGRIGRLVRARVPGVERRFDPRRQAEGGRRAPLQPTSIIARRCITALAMITTAGIASRSPRLGPPRVCVSFISRPPALRSSQVVRPRRSASCRSHMEPLWSRGGDVGSSEALRLVTQPDDLGHRFVERSRRPRA